MPHINDVRDWARLFAGLAPALLHFVVQGAIKVVDVPAAGAASFALVWMASAAAIPMLVFLVPHGATPHTTSAPLQRDLQEPSTPA